jgi:RecA-family ATPase
MTPSENRILEIQTARVDRNQTAKGFKFKLLREFSAAPPTKRHIIKGIFARGETSMWFGPPGSLKSSLMASAAIAIASGADWFGRRNKEKCSALYWALERNDLAERRLRADATSMDLPIAVVSDVIDIVNGRDNAKVIATIKELEEATGYSVGLVIFDTFSKLIAAGNGDEDKARDQNKLFANIQRIKNQTDIHVALVGHTGKEESRGHRGSNASRGTWT